MAANLIVAAIRYMRGDFKVIELLGVIALGTWLPGHHGYGYRMPPVRNGLHQTPDYDTKRAQKLQRAEVDIHPT